MSFRSVAAKNAVVRIVGVMTVAAAALVSVSVTSELPQEARDPVARVFFPVALEQSPHCA